MSPIRNPLPAAHPLWTLENAIITPHVASESAAPSERYMLMVVENLRRYIAGDPWPNVVDVKGGC
jgi:D-3-phosphoglycerate dehydrogenase